MMQTFLVVTQKTFLLRIYSSRLNILCYFFHDFIFWGTNIKGTIFSGQVRSHPSHTIKLRAWCNVIYRQFIYFLKAFENRNSKLLRFFCNSHLRCSLISKNEFRNIHGKTPVPEQHSLESNCVRVSLNKFTCHRPAT